MELTKEGIIKELRGAAKESEYYSFNENSIPEAIDFMFDVYCDYDCIEFDDLEEDEVPSEKAWNVRVKKARKELEETGKITDELVINKLSAGLDNNYDEIHEGGTDSSIGGIILTDKDEDDDEDNLRRDNMAGKYEICFEPYERYGSSAPRVAKFSAPDDFSALKKVAEKCSLYVSEDEFFDSEEEALEEGYDESELENLYFRDKTDIEEIVNDMTDCDGQDFIFYIMRPDGTYLFDSGCDSGCDDWDD